MAATQVQIRRDTDANLMAATPVQGEMGYNISKQRMHLGDGSTLGGMILPNARDIQSCLFTYATAGGTPNAITASLTEFPIVAALVPGTRVSLMITANNTGAVTFNLDGQGAANVYKLKLGLIVPLEADDLVADMIYELMFDGTDWLLIGFAPAISPGMEHMQTQTVSTPVGNVDFTQNFDSSDVMYYATFKAWRSTNGAQALIWRPSINGGSSYVTSASIVNGQSTLIPGSTNTAIANTAGGSEQLSNYGNNGNNLNWVDGFMWIRPTMFAGGYDGGYKSWAFDSNLANKMQFNTAFYNLSGNRINAMRFLASAGLFGAGTEISLWKYKNV